MTKTTKPKKAAKLSTEDQKKWGEVMELFEQFGEFMTVTESWQALRGLAETLKKNKMPNKVQINWFASAVERCKDDDEAQLLRELGLVMMGRTRTVNPKAVSGRVAELVASGSSIMAACEQASKEMGCTMKTAHRWYKAGEGSETDGRKK